MKKLAIIITLCVALVSCNKDKEIRIIEPPKELILNVIQTIDGDLGVFCSAKNEKIKITFKKVDDRHLPGFSFDAPIKINFTSPSNVKAGRGYNDYGPSLEIEFLNKEGKVIEDCRANMTISYTDLASFIKSGNREEWVTFSGRYILNSLEEDKSFEESKSYIDNISKAASIRIKSIIIEEKIDQNPNESVTDALKRINGGNDSKSSSGSGDCDDFLNEYEEISVAYINVCLEMSKNPKDLTNMSKMSELANKASKIKGDMKDCENDPAVVKRMIDIQLKMTNAALGK